MPAAVRHRAAGTNPYPADLSTEAPLTSATTTITLQLSPEDGIVALPAGPGSDWARAALDLARFEESHEGIHVLPLTDPTTAQTAIDTLFGNTSRFGISVNISRQPFIGDTASRIARALAGTWEIELGNLQLPASDARNRLHRAWSDADGPLPATTRSYSRQMPAAAFLTHEDGRVLVVTERPWDHQVLVGAIAPHTDFLALDVRQPISIAASTVPAAVDKVSRTLLPSYDRALVQAHLQMFDATLTRVHAARHGAEHPEMLPLAISLRAHAPYLIRHLHASGPWPSSAQSAAALDRASQALTADPPADDRSTAEMLDRWLDHGSRVTEMVRSLDPHIAVHTPHRTTAPPGLPPRPPGTSTGSSPAR
ncbi:hypothetical protein ABZ128_03535 [Streptomyces sp. NPDC006326]|uniref:hypothetical protein n=1 Tax=Streptomyces sp. NPDC006326 TaxID=3156752 RepID=UPI0033B8438A